MFTEPLVPNCEEALIMLDSSLKMPKVADVKIAGSPPSQGHWGEESAKENEREQSGRFPDEKVGDAFEIRIVACNTRQAMPSHES